MTDSNILATIAGERRRRIETEGHTLGRSVPDRRQVPIIPFAQNPLLIAEVKRRSPSRGDINPEMDPVRQAGAYRAAGVRSVSVLTEEGRFSGSLDHLRAVKETFPQLSVLRKDFLLDLEDIDVSFRAGADAILLIASLLSPELLAEMHRRADELGLTALVEVHSIEEIASVRSLGPKLVGVNSRDLATFRVDRLLPVRLRPFIDWPATTVFESGISCPEDVRFATDAGFSGVLVGEALARRPEGAASLLTELDDNRYPESSFAERMTNSVGARKRPQSRFWPVIAAHALRNTLPGAGDGSSPERAPRPIVKICGITGKDDGELAVELGADVIGFIFAESPRRAGAEVVRQLAHLNVLRVAVVVVTGAHSTIPTEVEELLQEGALDAVQFHGDETPEFLSSFAFSYYKAVRLQSVEERASLDQYRSPRILIDAFSTEAYGGTGRTLDSSIVRAIQAERPLWLAGGLSPDNIADVVQEFRPELVDVSSRLEAEPGKKDREKMVQFFAGIRSVK